jgi:hypothetical protein
MRRARFGPASGWRFALAVSALLFFHATASAQDDPPGAQKEDEKKIVRATVRQLSDAWLSVDAAVVGTYAGIDSAQGPTYHAFDLEEVWLGSPAPGRLLFKAPRGVGLEPGDEALLMLWDRLNGATDSYLENATRLHGNDAWRLVGPDSLASYLLPFPRYAFRFDGKRIRLRGTSAYRQDMKRSELRGVLLDYELTLLPTALFADSDLVVRARVRSVDKRKREIEKIAVEFRIYVDLEVLGMLKGEPPPELRLDYTSFPRAPRFDVDEEVILFLTQVEDRFFLKQGKRGVYHVIDGAVAETDQPLPEFVKSLQGASE